MRWSTGNWSSRRQDGGAALERDARGWHVYDTDETGLIQWTVADGFAPPVAGPFEHLEDAQAWSEEHQPQRGTP